MRGPAAASGGVFVSATRFTYRRHWQMPLVFWHGLSLRGEWGTIAGAVGMFTGANVLERTTYTVSAWTNEAALNRWLRSAYHARLMRDYHGYLVSVSAVSWLTDDFEREAAWSEAISRLKACPSEHEA